MDAVWASDRGGVRPGHVAAGVVGLDRAGSSARTSRRASSGLGELRSGQVQTALWVRGTCGGASLWRPAEALSHLAHTIQGSIAWSWVLATFDGTSPGISLTSSNRRGSLDRLIQDVRPDAVSGATRPASDIRAIGGPVVRLAPPFAATVLRREALEETCSTGRSDDQSAAEVSHRCAEALPRVSQPRGHQVVRASRIPVHLGNMSACGRHLDLSFPGY